MNKQRIQEKFEGAIIGGAIGDAIGLPAEMKTKKYIEENFGRINDYFDTKLNIFYAKQGFSEEGGGFVSDDTLLTMATMDSLSEKSGIDFQDMAEKHADYYFEYPYGFGKSTKNACEATRNGVSYLLTGNPNGTGNGIMMKQTPLAFYFLNRGFSEEEMNKAIEIYSSITHANKISIVSAIVHNKMLTDLILSEPEDLDNKRLISSLLEYSIKYEDIYYETDSVDDRLSHKLREILALIKEDGRFDLTDDEILEKFGWGDDKIYKSCYILCTLPIVYSVFLRNSNWEGLLDTVNIGGDTDSFAAIIGNMIGALRGRFYEDRFVQGLREKDMLQTKIKVFEDKFLS